MYIRAVYYVRTIYTFLPFYQESVSVTLVLLLQHVQQVATILR